MPTRRQVMFGQFHDPRHQSRAMAATFADSCLPRRGVVCRSCGEACELMAIIFPPAAGGVAPPFLRVEQCSGCGACIEVCPVGALRLAPVDFPEEFPA